MRTNKGVIELYERIFHASDDGKTKWLGCIKFFLIGILGLICNYIRRKKSLRLTGEVVDFFQNTQFHYIPIVQFQYRGMNMRMRLDRGFRRKLAEKGQNLEIYYVPSGKSSVRLVQDKRDILGCYTIILFTFIMILIGVL